MSNTYIPRIVEAELDELMSELHAVSIEGAKGVGKTSTATRRAATVLPLDDPGVREAVAAAPERIRGMPGPVLLDEWQRLPEMWDFVRREVDANPRLPGRYLLAGSAAPLGSNLHSGAGRIPAVRMRPLSLAERQLDQCTVSLSHLLEGGMPDMEGWADATAAEYAEEICLSGMPGLRGLGRRPLAAQLGEYVERIVQREFVDLGHRVRNPVALHSWLRAYGAATSTMASYNSLLDAATSGEAEKPAKTTVIQYRDVLEALWVLDPVEAWRPRGAEISSLGKAPQHHLADPALAAHMLGYGPEKLLSGANPLVEADRSFLGSLFQSLVGLSLRVYAQAAGAKVFHLRTHRGSHEVDYIVERRDGSLVAVEVKLGRSVGESDVRQLKWLRSRLGDLVLDSMVITTGTEAYRRPDGIAVVPASLLGP